MFNVLITDPISEQGLQILENDKINIIYKPKITEDELEAVVPEIHGWIIRSGTTITKKNIDRQKKDKRTNRQKKRRNESDFFLITVLFYFIPMFFRKFYRFCAPLREISPGQKFPSNESIAVIDIFQNSLNGYGII